MWPRSAPKMGCPRRKRRAMESVTSRIGTNSAINGETIHAVDQIKSVGAKKKPSECERQRQPALRGIAGNSHDAQSARISQPCANQLAKHFLPWLERDQVIQQAHEKNDRGRGQQPD